MNTQVQEFIATLSTFTPPPIVLFCPAKAPKAREATFEPLLAEQAAAALVEKYVDPSLRDLAYTVFYADEAKPGDILIEAQTLPFLAERRVILLRNAERYNTESGAGTILHYLESPTDTTLLIFVAATIDKRLKFYKLCEKNGLVVECPMLGEREAAQWVRAEIDKQGKRIEANAVDEIIRRAGTRLSDIRNAVNVVLGYAQTADVIREDDITAACADVAEEEVWTLTDAIASSQPGVCLRTLRRLMDMGKAEDELLALINWLLKTAYLVARNETLPPSISPFLAKKVRPLADKLGTRKLKDAFALTTNTHFMLRSTGVDQALALELLVVKLSAPRR